MISSNLVDLHRQVILESMERDHGFIFSALSADEKGNVVDAMEERQVAAGEELITQGGCCPAASCDSE